MLKESVTGRDGYILAMALIFTSEVLDKLPKDRRPDTAISDMKDILASMPRAIIDAADMAINPLLRQIEWEPPDHCQEAADQLAALISYAEKTEGVDVAPLCEQAEGVLRSVLRHAQHDYQQNLAHAAVDAVVTYLKAGRFSEPWRRHGVDMALSGLRKVGSAKPNRR
jgi:hypothetical protein